MSQTAISFMQIRAGSSKGIFLNFSDLPKDIELRNKVILAIMEGVGNGDLRQIDGLGGGDSLTSKVAIVGPSKKEGVVLEYLFLQVVIGKGIVIDAQNCGNILSGVLPFAIEKGMVETTQMDTTAVIHMLNSDSFCEVTVFPHWEITYEGDAKVDGVPGTGSPIFCNYLDVEGASTGDLLPTGNLIDLIDGIEVTCIDNGMPVVNIRATDVGITGYETKDELNDNIKLKEKLEKIRLQAGIKMNLGDVLNKTVPKMTLISKAKNGGLINTRTFIPHVCHTAIGVLGAVSVASACILKGSVADRIANIAKDIKKQMSVEHPSGEFTVKFELEQQDNVIKFNKSGVLRTARPISKGVVYIPESIWKNKKKKDFQ
ncbi:MAG: 4-oxalomesaconate tautomerase [Flavobacteriaceae bacterium]|nr:MAG: 4-oxalomesaconate tautomerase [Flavobacteriaceae bacterium]